MNQAKKDYIFYSIVIIFAVFFLTSTPQIQSTNQSFIIGPTTWPYILLILMVFLGLYGIVSTLIKAKIMKSEEITAVQGETEPVRKIFKLSIPIVSLLVVIIYVLLLNIIGFIFSTILFLYGITLLLGTKKQWTAILFSIITMAIFVILFSVLLQIPLPRGVGVFRAFSLFFY
ncbi:tripartite tricarboxylate transporter TctB family protein [Oceanobacillus sojae]|uniref:tripartite tricarboxylate transporter TctB family protein n=1 Tax=Oceanobacillus sojae TaxID=582851 RepID=UPI00158C21CA|nr:tripartite tricarboxylate transporter TctB family protein [Oceanobacillus sojae]